MNKNVIKTLKIGIIVLVVVCIIVGVIVFKNIKNEKKNQVTLDNLPSLNYTEEQAKEFYSKTLIKYLGTFQGDFHFKYKAEMTKEDGSTTVSNEEYSKKGNTTSVYYAEENSRIIIEEKNIYHIDEDNHLILKQDNSDNFKIDMDIFFYSLDSMNNYFENTGYEVLNNQKFYFEEYKMEIDNSVLIRYYFDENDSIKYIKVYKENSNVQTFFTVEMLENRTYDFMFDTGEKYTFVN